MNNIYLVGGTWKQTQTAKFTAGEWRIGWLKAILISSRYQAPKADWQSIISATPCVWMHITYSISVDTMLNRLIE